VFVCPAAAAAAAAASLTTAQSDPNTHLSFVQEEGAGFNLTGRTGSLMYMAPEGVERSA